LRNGNTRAYSDLPAVDILNLIYKAAAATWPLAMTFVSTCLFGLHSQHLQMLTTETVHQLNRPIHHGGCRRLGDQNIRGTYTKYTCQQVTGITELFEAQCCRQNENNIPIKDDTVDEN